MRAVPLANRSVLPGTDNDLMSNADGAETNAILRQMRYLAVEERIRVTQHAQREMVEEDIAFDEILEAISSGGILENYPEHRRGACCLLCGRTLKGRPRHIVCTTAQALLVIITVYEPKPPKWVTPSRRR